jgi:hypothetical protein
MKEMDATQAMPNVAELIARLVLAAESEHLEQGRGRAGFRVIMVGDDGLAAATGPKGRPPRKAGIHGGSIFLEHLPLNSLICVRRFLPHADQLQPREQLPKSDFPRYGLSRHFPGVLMGFRWRGGAAEATSAALKISTFRSAEPMTITVARWKGNGVGVESCYHGPHDRRVMTGAAAQHRGGHDGPMTCGASTAAGPLPRAAFMRECTTITRPRR